MTDHTHDPNLTSWIDGAQSGDFTIQNLPYGVFRRAGSDDDPRIGVAIGDQVLDIAGCIAENLLEGLAPETACALSASTLNSFFAQGPKAWRETRHAISSLLSRESATLRDNDQLQSKVLVPMSEADMLLPAAIGDYTDFYASIHHATNVGSMFRPDNPLLPNYKHLPVGYHGRASSIVPSGTDIRRPKGQTKADDAEFPTYGPCRLLDYELELGFFVGPGNEMGSPITMQDASSHIFGMVLLNDWSARDVQKWEYQPLGPFNAKNFASTISPWVVTLDALEPYRIPGPARGDDDPPIIDYLQPADDMGLDITVEAYLSSKQMREQGAESLRLSRGN
ncbi:MAG: fumarylacetoacetase, partial [Planctomycetes bacterium]|nr:fumarylacetoacetase [Planctomycetota bacterium]